MPATLNRFRTRPQKRRDATADRFVQLALELEGLAVDLGLEPPDGLAALRAKLEREAQGAGGWTFVMISPGQHKVVSHWLRRHSRRPLVAMGVWAELFDHLDPRTGEVMLSRRELARAVEADPGDVSRVMTELAGLGAIIPHRVPANGPVRYFLNPRVGSNLPKEARDLAQAAAPRLRLVE